MEQKETDHRFDVLLEDMIAGEAPSAGKSQESIKHQMRDVTHIVAILKLPQILRKMLPADMNVRAVDAAL